MGAPALAIRQGVLPEIIPPDHTARLRCGSFAFRRLRRIQNWRSSSSLYRLHCGLIPIETGRTGALRAGACRLFEPQSCRRRLTVRGEPWSTAMLAEIFMLKLEAAARAAKLPSPSSQFVPVTLPAAKAS